MSIAKVGGAALAVGVAVVLAQRIFASMAVGLRLSRIDLRVRRLEPGELSLPRNKYTTQDGSYGARWASDSAHARIGEVTAQHRNQVTRPLIRVHGPSLRTGTRITWSGQVFNGPEDLGIPHKNVVIETSAGPAPAWYFPPRATDNHVWVIHVHGIRVTRLSPLRGVPAAAEAGSHSLVISYRGDTEGPPQQFRQSTLGLTESADVDSAIQYAADHGAERIVLMGWSMGGSMALLAAHEGAKAHLVDDLILVAPITDWRRVLLHGAQETHLPAWLGRAVVNSLSAPAARFFGSRYPINFTKLDWIHSTNRVTKPCLVIHTRGDDEVPFELTQEFANANDLVRLTELPAALHTLEWNRSPAAFDAAVTGWVTSTQLAQ